MILFEILSVNTALNTGLAILISISVGILSYAIHKVVNNNDNYKNVEKSITSCSQRERIQSEDMVEIPPMYLHFHKLICALSEEVLPNWCRHLQIEWSDIIQDITEWMEKVNHPNLEDFESCTRILLNCVENCAEPAAEEESDGDESGDETDEGDDDSSPQVAPESSNKPAFSPIQNLQIQQARRWMNMAFFVWTQQPSTVLPAAWFILSDLEDLEEENAPTNSAEAHDSYLDWLAAAKDFAEKRGFNTDFKTADELSRLLVPWLNENKNETNENEFNAVLEKLGNTRRLVEEFVKKEMDPSRFKSGEWVTVFDGEVHGPFDTYEAACESVQSAKYYPNALTWQIQ
jgi:hypothetical protein